MTSPSQPDDVSEEETLEEGHSPSQEEKEEHNVSAKTNHTAPSRYSRNKKLLVIASSLLVVSVGVALGVVLSLNKVGNGGEASRTSALGGVDMAEASGVAPPPSSEGTFGSEGGKTKGTIDSAPADDGSVPEKVPVALPPSGSSPTQSGQLTAADIDDNLNFEHYLSYSETMYRSAQPDGNLQHQLPGPDLSKRVIVRVTNGFGDAFSCANIEIGNEHVPVHGETALRTSILDTVMGSHQTSWIAGTDGNFYLFPALYGLSDVSFSMRARAPGGTCPDDCSESVPVLPWGNGVINLQIAGTSSLPSKMDLALIIDTTGSMCDELSYLQKELEAVLLQVTAETAQTVDIRVALVAYKDHGDSYVVSTSTFDTPENTVASLLQYTCGGGGDYPEAMDEALDAAAELQWRSGNVARVVLLVADAPPHDNKLQAAFDAALKLVQLGVKVYGLAASGVADMAEYEMRLMGVVSGARYLWLTDDSGIGNPHAEPNTMCYQVTRLDHLLIRVLKSELSGERVEATQTEIVREFGVQQNGVCQP